MQQAKACFGNNCFDVDLAISIKEKTTGLMFKEKMDANRGMLFVYDREGQYGFWMKNTKMPLDIIWISASNEIIFISKNTQPCAVKDCPVVRPDENAKYVLEINAGLADKIGLKIKDKADLFLPEK